MASGGRWWSLSADYRMIKTCTRCLFRWLKVRLISRHPKWSLCLFCFPGLPKHSSWSWKFTAQTTKGGQSVPWRLSPPTRETLFLVVSLELWREVCIFCDSSWKKSPAMLQKCVRDNLTPWYTGTSWFPLALFQQTADVGWHGSSSGLRTHLTKQSTFCF